MDPLPAKKLIDPVLLARNKLRMSFKKLETKNACFVSVTEVSFGSHHQ